MIAVFRMAIIAIILMCVCVLVALGSGASTHGIAIGVEIAGLALTGSTTLIGLVAARDEPFGLVIALVMGGLTTFLIATGPISF